MKLPCDLLGPINIPCTEPLLRTIAKVHIESTKSSNPLIAPDYFLHHLNSPACYPSLSLLPLANQPFLSLFYNLFGFHLALAMMVMLPPAPTALPTIVDLHSCLLLGEQMNT